MFEEMHIAGSKSNHLLNRILWLAVSPWMGGILGLVVFTLIFGVKILNPTYIDWIFNHGGDMVGQFTGWEAFRHEAWHFPPGVLQSLGFPMQTSIIYYDPIPLLAFFFKIFSNFIPQNFQYYGMWIAACFFLQGFFGWLLVSLVTQNNFYRALGTIFFILSPIMLFRLEAGHEALGAQWILLAGLYLYSQRDTHVLNKWLTLILFAALIQPYLLAMVLGVWIGALCKIIFIEKKAFSSKFVMHIFIVFLGVWLVFWLSGLFVFNMDKVQEGGFGFYSFNLLAPIDPLLGGPAGSLSRILKPINYAFSGQYEGFNYLGAGVLLLCVAAIFQMIANKKITWDRIRPWIPLGVVFSVFFIHAVSTTVALGPYTLLTYSTPHALQHIQDIFRSSGRFFWPMYYAIIFWALAFVLTYTNQKLIKTILISTLCLQAADFLNYYQYVHINYSKMAVWDNPLKADFWEKAADHYKHIVFVPPYSKADIPIFAHYASHHNLTINVTGASRQDHDTFKKLHKLAAQDFMQGVLDRDSFYIVSDLSLLRKVIDKLSSKDGVGQADGYYVIAPNWYSFADCCSNKIQLSIPTKFQNYAMFPMGKKIVFSNKNISVRSFLLSGWSTPEGWGVWSDGNKAQLSMQLQTSNSTILNLEILPYLAGAHKTLSVEVDVNGKPQTIWHLNTVQTYKKQILLVPSVSGIAQKYVISFIFNDAKSPAELGVGKDTRKLAIGLRSAYLTEQTQN